MDIAPLAAAPSTPSGASSAASPAMLSPDYWRKQREKTYGDQFTQLATVLQSLDDAANPLVEMLGKFNAQAYGNRSFRSALSVTLSTARTAFMADFILHHAKALGSPAMVWAVMLLWLADEKGLTLDRHALRLLQAELSGIAQDNRMLLIQSLNNFADKAGTKKAA